MRYISVEGCVGVGKTTITALLSSALQAHAVFEDSDMCPFLDDFYENTAAYTFETELSFLLIHYHQLIKALHEGHEFLISDYFFDREEEIFAKTNITSEKERMIFLQLFGYLQERIIQPDVIICLTGKSDMIYRRVIKRGRNSERNISYEYIDKINSHYNDFFTALKRKYITIDIDMNIYDFIQAPSLVNVVLKRLHELKIT